MDSRALWSLVKPLVRELNKEASQEEEEGVLIIDDTIEEKTLHRRERTRLLALRP